MGFEPTHIGITIRGLDRLTTRTMLAQPEGFEPPTPAFVAQCSIQMSYGRRLNLRAYAAFIVDLFRTYRPPSLTSSTMDITWAPSSVVSITDLRGSPQVGVEPICLLLFWSFEET
jgi:hypothetical protein